MDRPPDELRGCESGERNELITRVSRRENQSPWSSLGNGGSKHFVLFQSDDSSIRSSMTCIAKPSSHMCYL